MDKTLGQDYLLQNLDNVYVYTDPRTYPLSSYSYMIIPTGQRPDKSDQMTTAKRQTLADFLYYSICQGQAEMGPIGYSPLPVNLVQAGLRPDRQAAQRPTPSVDLTNENVDDLQQPDVRRRPTQPATTWPQIAPAAAGLRQAGAGPCTDAGHGGRPVRRARARRPPPAPVRTAPPVGPPRLGTAARGGVGGRLRFRERSEHRPAMSGGGANAAGAAAAPTRSTRTEPQSAMAA